MSSYIVISLLSFSVALRKAVDVPNLKVAIVGDPLVGKTSILSRYIHNQFSPLYIQTHKAAIENVVRKLNVPSHAKVPVTFWDIPGHEDLPLHSSYFTDLDAAIVVVDLSVPASLESAIVWRQTVLGSASFTNSNSDQTSQGGKEEQLGSNDSINIEDIPFLLLGNKLDLCMDKGKENEEEITTVENLEKVDAPKEKAEESLAILNRVQQLEEIAGKGFTGSVSVSARNNDLSVHAAIQTFLRRILETRSLVQRRWIVRPDNQQKDKTSGRPRYEQERQLKSTRIQEIDAKFTQAEEILYRVTSLQRYQEDSLRKFSAQCVEAGVIASSQDASMQNCLVGLKEKLTGLDLKLQYAAVTKAILAEFPIAETKLSQIESQVNQLCSQEEIIAQLSHGHKGVTVDASAPTTSADDERGWTASNKESPQCSGQSSDGMRTGAVVERNRAVLRHVAHECNDCLAHIQRSVKQAKAAFVCRLPVIKKSNMASQKKKALQILKDIDKNLKQAEIAQKYGISKSTVSVLVKNRQAIEDACLSLYYHADRKRMRTGKEDKVDEAIFS
ncbi:GTP-binding protein YPT7 [Elysia marginata]|uniref:GTP-binding protein YPT7 n=1 Tax=Elysia marginata TaxID=1093978 RepID=A0AAV4HV34_9GAST|nr:GTP-binding protein YPT7 [Elysia marginata]